MFQTKWTIAVSKKTESYEGKGIHTKAKLYSFGSVTDIAEISDK